MHSFVILSIYILAGSFQGRHEYFTPSMEEVLLATKDVRFTDTSAHAPFDTTTIKKDSASITDSVWTPVDKVPEVIRGAQPPRNENGPYETVRVKMLLTREGQVKRAVIYSSENPSRNRVALTFAMMWSFTPAIQKDKSVPVWVVIPFRFSK